MKKPGPGQTDVILDGLQDAELAAEYDRLVGMRDIHRCEMCRRPMTAEESRAFGIGHDCARDLGREVWARMRTLRESVERGAPDSGELVREFGDRLLRDAGVLVVESAGEG